MRISDALLSMQWAILESYLVRMDQCDQEVKAYSQATEAGGGSYRVADGIATIALKGVIFQEPTHLSQIISFLFGGTVLSSFVVDMQAAEADRSVHSVLIDANSPGGEAFGIEAAAAVIRGMQKPVSVFVDGMAASAAYWLASAADRIVLSGESSQVGSVGVVLGIRDMREADAKAGIKRHEIVSSQSPKKRADPTTDEGMAQLQAYCDQLAEVFIKSVGANRLVTPETVKATFGQGAMVMGSDAVGRGMADGISSREALLGSMRAGQFGFGGSAARSSKGARAAMKTPEELAAEQRAAAEKTQAEVVSAAKTAGMTEGRKLERARYAAILSSDEAKDRQILALSMASETEMDAEMVKKLLAKAPLETKTVADPLKAAMAGVRNPKLGTDPGDGTGELDEAGEVAAVVAAGNRARGGK